MPSETLLQDVIKTSARVGSLLVPARALESCLGRFASQLTVWTHDEIYKIRLVGSAIGVRCLGRAVLLCSRHQLDGVDLRDVGLLLPDGSDFITSSGSRTFSEAEFAKLSDAYDVAVFDFTFALTEFPELTNCFFNFKEAPPTTPNVGILAFIVVGYPSSDQKYELEDKNHLGMVRRILVAELDSQPSDFSLLKLKFATDLDFDPDGLSGGPAYVVQLVSGQPTVFLAGMTIRAGKSHCYILKSGFLWDFIGLMG